MKIKNRSYRYGINRPKSAHGHKYSICKKCLIMTILICIKQHLSNTWTSIHERLNNTDAKLKKSVAYKKNACNWRNKVTDI